MEMHRVATQNNFFIYLGLWIVDYLFVNPVTEIFIVIRLYAAPHVLFDANHIVFNAKKKQK